MKKYGLRISLAASVCMLAAGLTYAFDSNEYATLKAPMDVARKVIAVDAENAPATSPLSFKQVRQSSRLHDASPVGLETLSLKAAETTPGSAPIYAVMMYSSEWTKDTGEKKGVYSIPTDGSSTTPTEIDIDPVFTDCAYAVGMPDRYHFGQVVYTYGVIMSLTQYTYNTADWSHLSTLRGDITSRNFQSSDAAYNPVTTEIYGSVLDIKANTWGIYRIENESALVFKYVASLDAPLTAMDFDKDGKLYAVTHDGKFITYDLATKKSETIGTGLPLSTKYTSGTIDNANGKFYYAVCNDTQSALIAIDLKTGSASKLYDFAHGEEFVGMYFPSASSTAVLPAAPTNVKYSFPTTELKGTLTFDSPKTTTDGSVAEGALTYTVYAGITKAAEGTTEYGASESVEVEVPANGDFTFTVRVANENGESAPAKISGWIGADAPNKISTAPTVTYANGKATIKWLKPYGSKGPNGGYVDATKYTYTVVRNNDNKVIAEDITALTATDEFEAPEELSFYSYDVTVNYEGASSQPVTSATLALGSILPPYTVDFTSDPLSLFTTLDANKDYYVWAYSATYQRLHVSQNRSKDMDDWLFTLPIKFKAGNIYNVSFDTFGGADGMTQKMAVFLGTAPDVDHMNTLTIMPEQEYTNIDKDPLHISYDLEVPEDGQYYIGFHAMSAMANSYCCLNNIKIGAAIDFASPASVSDFTVTPDIDGALKVDISLVAPTKTIKNATLDKLTKIEVRVGEDVIKTFDAPKPGATCKYTYVTELHGDTEFTAVAINDKGESQPVTATTFIGHTVPYAPANPVMKENTPGNVTITWDEVTKDANGKNIDPSTVTYSVMELNQTMLRWEPLAENITELTHTMQIMKETDEQDFVSLAMAATNEYGRSKYRAIDQVPIGVPYYLPYTESNTGGGVSHTFLRGQISGKGYARWLQGTNSTFQGMVAADGDNGYFYMEGEQVGDRAGFTSGKISLEGAQNPIFTIAYVQFKNDKNKIGIDIICDGVTENLGEWTTAGTASEWAMKSLPLDKYKGKVIQYILWGECVTSTTIFADYMQIMDYPQKDVAIKNISAPKTLTSGYPDEVKVLVENTGMNDISGHTVTFYVNDEEVAHIDATNTLSFKGQATYGCKISANPVSDDVFKVHAVVTVDGDLAADNNKSEVATIDVIKPTLPEPINLTAKLDDTGSTVNLTWDDASDTSLSAAPVTDDCEKYESFSISGFGGWSTIDADKSVSNSFSGITVPHMGNEAFGFMIFDASGNSFNSTFAAHSGNKYFMSFTNEAQACDDWLISPELCGNAQTISFFARGYHPDFPESFEILYSTTGKEIADFKLAKSFDKVGNTFTEYTAELPAGAKYFAVRCTSKKGFMFIVDDISFTPGEQLKVEGYNLYRNGKLLKGDIKEKAFADMVKEKASHTYNVTALYNYGESKASDDAVVDLTGVEDAMASAVNVSVVDRTIVVTGAEGCNVAVYNAAGVEVFAAASNGHTTYQAAQGIYLVKVADSTYKVIVK